ncbi:MAG: hypothetical protein CVV05_09110 [Gammaproteobacteria bacterium HGW-Gammaproteobacteria-1]|nr:MAG: hypothetical protein CVV05_09110 [Gammaproteobacteria bacterium HGW-Gammaproteobacteria-1]PKO86547.1 MAG: hypothetical protein CVU18_14460 [Betaproteobacteria bacterium HGW-Betaproteobacteria-12]
MLRREAIDVFPLFRGIVNLTDRHPVRNVPQYLGQPLKHFGFVKKSPGNTVGTGNSKEIADLGILEKAIKRRYLEPLPSDLGLQIIIQLVQDGIDDCVAESVTPFLSETLQMSAFLHGVPGKGSDAILRPLMAQFDPLVCFFDRIRDDELYLARDIHFSLTANRRKLATQLGIGAAIRVVEQFEGGDPPIPLPHDVIAFGVGIRQRKHAIQGAQTALGDIRGEIPNLIAEMLKHPRNTVGLGRQGTVPVVFLVQPETG